MKFFDHSDEEIISIAEPIMESLKEGTNKNNYDIFSKYFSSKMFDLVDKKRFTEQTEKNVPIFGKLSAQTILGCVRREFGVTVIYRQNTMKKKGELVGQVSLDNENGEFKVINAGLF